MVNCCHPAAGESERAAYFRCFALFSRGAKRGARSQHASFLIFLAIAP